MDFKQKFIVDGNPIGKPRMTKADVWKKRPIVLQYRAWADKCREACTGDKDMKIRDEKIIGVSMTFYFSAPASLSAAKSRRLAGTAHRVRPDIDNCIKSVMDSLFELDSTIYYVTARKMWAEGGKTPRTEVEILTHNPDDDNISIW